MRKSIVERMFAMILVIILVVTMMPNAMSYIVASADEMDEEIDGEESVEAQLKIAVMDSEDKNPIEDAEVKLSARSSDSDEWIYLDLIDTSDDDGIATYDVTEIKQKLFDADIEEGYIKYIVTAYGYGEVDEEVNDEFEITEENLSKTYEKEMECNGLKIVVKNKEDLVNDATVELYGRKTDNGEKYSLELSKEINKYGVAIFTIEDIEEAVNEVEAEEDVEINHITYAVNSYGYSEGKGTIEYKVTDLIDKYEVTMELDGLKIVVKDGENPINEAEVKLSAIENGEEGQEREIQFQGLDNTTNQQGVVIFSKEDIEQANKDIRASVIKYSVEVEGYKKYENDINYNQIIGEYEAPLIKKSLDITVYEEDEETAIEGAEVKLYAKDRVRGWVELELTSITDTTDGYGKVSFVIDSIKDAMDDMDLEDTSIKCTVSMYGYNEGYVDDIDIFNQEESLDQSVQLTRKTITFNVKDGTQPISRAEIVIYNNDSNQIATIETQEDGSASLDVKAIPREFWNDDKVQLKYKIIAAGYRDLEGDIEYTSQDKSKTFEIPEEDLIRLYSIEIKNNLNEAIEKIELVNENGEVIGEIIDNRIKYVIGEDAIGENTVVKLQIMAKEGYRISSLTGLGDFSNYGLKDKDTISIINVSEGITVTDDVEVTVGFVKVYDIIVSCDANGRVACEGNITETSEEGKVIVAEGENITINATPNEGYRVQSVVINGNDETDVNTANSSTYSKVLETIEDDYLITIAFAPNVYEVSLAEVSNGEVHFAEDSTKNKITVEHGQNCKVVLKPNDGYSVSKIKINANSEIYFEQGLSNTDIILPEVTVNYNYSDIDNSIIINLKGITSGITLYSEFKTNEMTNRDSISFVGNFVEYQDRNIISYHKDTTEIKIQTEYNAMWISAWDENGQWMGGFSDSKEFTFNRSVIIYYIGVSNDGHNYYTVEGTGYGKVLSLIIDKESPTLEVNVEDEHYGEFYNKDFSAQITVRDGFSKPVSIEYFVTDTKIDDNITGQITEKYYDEVSVEKKCSGKIESLGVYYDTNNNKYTVNQDINVLVEQLQDSNYVSLWVKVSDQAENVSCYKTEYYKVSTTLPSLKVEMLGTSEADEDKFYNTTRSAKITITDTDLTFEEEKAFAGIKVFVNGTASNDYEISSEWTKNGNNYEATIQFNQNAVYKWEIKYINKAGNSATSETTSISGKNVFEFVVDTECPTGAIFYLENRKWKMLHTVLSFGYFNRYEVPVEIETKDNICKHLSVLYYKTDFDKILTVDELDKLYTDGVFGESYTVRTYGKDEIHAEQYIIYVRIADCAGNVKYISTKGIVSENVNGTISFYSKENIENKIHNKDVTIDFVVNEVMENYNICSGIKSIDYSIVAEGKPKKEGNLFKFEGDASKEDTSYTYEELVKQWDSTDEDKSSIVVSAGDGENQYNCDNIKVTVTVTDNAENVYSESIVFSINVDKLSATIKMDKPNFVEEREEVNGEDTEKYNHAYYGGEQVTATITINDRESSFDEKVAKEGIKVYAVDKNLQVVTGKYSGGDVWTHDGNMHTTTVTFYAGAEYDLSIQYKNAANNELQIEDIIALDKDNKELVAPYSFTVDNEQPKGNVTILGKTWNALLDTITFGLYSQTIPEVLVVGEKELSPVIVKYYKTDSVENMSVQDLSRIEFVNYDELEYDENENCVVYVKLEDYAGNITYICSDGFVIDDQACFVTLSDVLNGGVYSATSDVKVNIFVQDKEPYSGIKYVEYWVKKDGVITQLPKTIYDINDKFDFESKIPTYSDLGASVLEQITVDKSVNNSSNVIVYVKAVDNAGMEIIEEIPLDIDITKPGILIEFDNNKGFNNTNYFDGDKTANVVIKERPNHFDDKKAEKAIDIQVFDGEGNKIDGAYNIGAWKSVINNQNPDESTHTATITFTGEGNYKVSVAYTDDAGNANSTDEPLNFTIDKTNPTGTIKAESTEGRKETWDGLVKEIVFGFWSKDKISISGTFDDVISGKLYSVEYYKVKSINAKDGTTVFTTAQLDDIKDWTKINLKTVSETNKVYYTFEGIDVDSDEQFIVYVKLTDLAGRVTYLSTNGLIVDSKAPIEKTIAPKVSVTQGKPLNGIYKKDVEVDIVVDEPMAGGTYAGLKHIYYEVYNMGVKTQSKDLFTFDKSNPKQSELVNTWFDSIVVDAELNNSNDVKIVVYAIDNAGNLSSGSVYLKIDTTSPKIDIAYDNNSADTSFASENLFDENRVATIRVTERNFDPNDVVIDVTNTDGILPVLSNWTVSKRGTGNGDDTEYMATLTYNADGDYKFDIKYTDEAGNVCTDIDYGQSLAPREFTIDKTLPTIQISYDNNSVSNGNYYKQDRIATVTVTEHNFDSSRFNLVLTATDNGKQIQLPVESQWTSNGDVHRITVPFIVDGYYTIDADFADKAGNAAADISVQSFYIDKTNPKLSVSGVTDRSANNDDVIGLEIITTDTNIDKLDAKVYAIVQSNGTYKTENIDIGSAKKITNGYKITVPNFEADGMYKVVCYANDKAGNVFTEVILDNGQGSTYVENRGNGEELMSFSVNRDGSVYVFDQNLEALKNSYKLSIENDIKISEFNADKLLQDSVNISITRDGSPLDTVKVEKSAIEDGSSWNQYDYIISKDNFKLDGIYVITVSSQDAAGNHSGNIADDKYDIRFCVDSTKPDVIRMSNLDNNTFNKVSHIVEYEVFDAIGLKEIRIYLDGKRIQTITEAEFGDNITSYLGSFTIDEASKKQHIRIEVVDIAGNIIDSDNAEDIKSGKIVSFEKDITVSTNPFVRWYSNAPLFYGSIVAAIAVIGGMVGLVTLRNKRKIRGK
ncbi:MAG: hypothetical protein IJD58_12885 [Lachnospiraceae bacterium]|nr:hypothetical protein [Lachnospiraceae bacterium]